MMKRIVFQYDPFDIDSRIIFAEDERVTDIKVIPTSQITDVAVEIARAYAAYDAEKLSIYAPPVYFNELIEHINNYSLTNYSENIIKEVENI